MICIKEVLRKATHLLEPYVDNPRIDAEILLAHIFSTNRTYLYTHPDQRLTRLEWQAYEIILKKRCQGQPVAYLIGHRHFWDLQIQVDNRVLIPRPETELLVEITLGMLSNQTHIHLLELGTGSGIITLSLAKERPDWHILAIDISPDALEVAKKNAASFKISNLEFRQSDWFEHISEQEQFEAIVSNPPYIAANDPHLKQGDVRFEPTIALIGGSDGLSAFRQIIQQSLARLKPGGILLLEHGYDQKSAVSAMFNDYGYEQIHCWKDWQNNDRVSCGRRKIE